MMKIRRSALSKQHGYALANVLLALILTGVVTQAFAPRLREGLVAPTLAQTAAHAERIRDAVDRYVRDNAATLASNAPLNGPSIGVTLQQLRDAGYLPSSTTDVNAYGQTYAIRVRHITQGAGPNQRDILEPMIVTTGGRAIPESDLRRVAGQIKGGGFISANAPTVAKGAQGGWSDVALASFGVNPGAGRLAVALFYDQAGTMTEYLYRNAVAGRPEVNRMNTGIDMNSQNLANAGNVTAQQATISGNATVNGSLVLSAADGSRYGGWTMVDNTWVRSIGDRSIYTGGTIQSNNMQANSLTSGTVSASVVDGSVINGQSVAGGSVTAYGRMYANEYMQVSGVATAGWGCSPNGLVGRSAAGGLLSCDSGVWRAPGGGLAQYSGQTCPAGMNVYGIYAPSYRYKGGSSQSGWLTNSDIQAMYVNCTGSGDAGEFCDTRPVYTGWDQYPPSSVKCG
jgi:hypothetical protein